MATIKDFLGGLTVEQLEAMTDAELASHFAPYTIDKPLQPATTTALTGELNLDDLPSSEPRKRSSCPKKGWEDEARRLMTKHGIAMPELPKELRQR